MHYFPRQQLIFSANSQKREGAVYSRNVVVRMQTKLPTRKQGNSSGKHCSELHRQHSREAGDGEK